MQTVEDLERRLAEPSPGLITDLAALDGDLLVLGAAGKLGPSLVRLALAGIAKAGTGATVYAASRFGSPGSEQALRDAGAETVVADLTDERALAGLPDAANVIFLVGAKFGSYGNEADTWHTNCYLPGRVAERFAGSRITALSTGNVYPLVDVASGGADESTPPDPVGEYAMSCLGRERVMTAVAARHQTPLALIRLNYAVELRYGVLVDLGQQIMAGEPVDLSTGAVNVIWQGFANEVTLRSLLRADVPPLTLNLTGVETLQVRDLAQTMADRLGRPVTFTGTEQPTALLSDARRCRQLFGGPAIEVDELIGLTAGWLQAGGPVHGKPTKFQRRDGKF
ncbi:NAD-dependent epimerase/dehydratase family protein [Microlunatus soli]|uniref:Nucleoside-diphosphate-sugar epimerase n=1 Tax=Microlunatus soli TaxID=630515 RepID=A0A1H1USB4_9ACTN|nr:NAD-dependent epimerase/dehydratase family protein [Microlunatus soli]SDS75432.1 Nucleoside-diphosphate-sugar epimerase [Microlunatus soli]